MAHIIYLRECPTFIQGEGFIQGTHEVIEQNIAKDRIPLKKFRDGYDIATGSEFKLGWYRCKKESIPHILENMRHINLKPPKVNILELLTIILIPQKIVGLLGYEKSGFCLRKKSYPPNHWKIGTIPAILMLSLQFLPFLKSVPKVKIQDTYSEGHWHYTFIIGIIEDRDIGFGEEL